MQRLVQKHKLWTVLKGVKCIKHGTYGIYKGNQGLTNAVKWWHLNFLFSSDFNGIYPWDHICVIFNAKHALQLL